MALAHVWPAERLTGDQIDHHFAVIGAALGAGCPADAALALARREVAHPSGDWRGWDECRVWDAGGQWVATWTRYTQHAIDGSL